MDQMENLIQELEEYALGLQGYKMEVILAQKRTFAKLKSKQKVCSDRYRLAEKKLPNVTEILKKQRGEAIDAIDKGEERTWFEWLGSFVSKN